MHRVDYLIVGLGVSGLCFAHELMRNSKSFLVIDEQKEYTSSKIAAGLYNPVILKRFTPIWQVHAQFKQFHATFDSLERLLQNIYRNPLSILRIIKNENEAKTWEKKARNMELETLLSCSITQNTHSEIMAPYGFGSVNLSGRVNLSHLIQDFQNFLIQRLQFIGERFDYSSLEIHDNFIHYKSIEANAIVFCEGVMIKQNPFFKNIPVLGNKGNALTVRLPKKLPNQIFKSKVFLAPNAKDYEYYVGATYQPKYVNDLPDLESKSQLENKLQEFLSLDYKILNHHAAIRPTVADRRPIIGRHPDYKNLILLNGMGSRGTLLAPTMAKKLFDHLEQEIPIPDEVSIKRFQL